MRLSLRNKFVLVITGLPLLFGWESPAQAFLAEEPPFDNAGKAADESFAPVRCPAARWIVKFEGEGLASPSLDGSPGNTAVETARSEAALRLSEAAGMSLEFVREMSGGAYIFAAPASAAAVSGGEAAAGKALLPAAGECITEEQAWAAAERLSALAGVEYAEPDRILGMALTPNDNLFYWQWHLKLDSYYGINMPAAWDITTGSPDGVVAVVDTGTTYPAELQGRLLPGFDMVSDAWMANDGGGMDADASDPGDWVYADECFVGSPPSSSSWHGTHVAGTIGANSNNGEGVAGINWGAKILPVRVLGRCGGYISDIVDGMRWAAGLAVPGVPPNLYPAEVVNVSITGRGVCGAVEQTAINEMMAAGAVVVVAAGNENANVEVFTPASCAGALTVAATDIASYRAPYSNFGALVDLSAPGGTLSGENDPEWRGVLSLSNVGPRMPAMDDYAFYQGTSMAAPHVAGTASLLYSLIPGITPAQASQVILDTVTPFSEGSTCTPSICGRGIVNAGAALQILPRITSLSPPRAAAGSSLTLTVNGANFASGAAIYWDGANRATTFVSASQLSVELSAADLAAPGTHLVNVETAVRTYGTMRTRSKPFAVDSTSRTCRTAGLKPGLPTG
jgi:serine protease